MVVLEAAEVEDAANDDEEDAALALLVVPPPSDFHMEEGDAGLFMAVAIAALDCCQNVVLADVVAVAAGCCC